jgi:hypothetical protein
MKIIYLITILLTSISVVAQRYEYAGINKQQKKFKHEYRFWFDNLEDSNTYSIDTINSSTSTVIKFKDNKDQSVYNLCIKLTNLETKMDSTFWFIDDSSTIQIGLETGTYRMTSEMFKYYDPIDLTFAIENNKQIKIQYNLGKAPQFDGYFIYSKRILSQDKVAQIMQCVKESSNEEFNEKCKQSYYRVWFMM